MSEVQQVADRVGIIRDGVLVAVQGVDALLETASLRVEIVFSVAPALADFADLPE